MAGRYDITIEQGARYQLTLDVDNDDGTDKDLTGYSARMHIRENVDDSTAIDKWTTKEGQITIAEAAGEITVDVPGSTTQGYNFEQAVYDLEIEDGNGNITRLLKGDVSLSKEVTRETGS